MDVRHVAQLLDISVDHLDSFVKCIGSGGIGKKRDDSWIPNPEPYDTQSTSPVVVITYVLDLVVLARNVTTRGYQTQSHMIPNRPHQS